MSEGIRKYEIMDRLDMQQQLQALRDEVARLRGAIVWALGYTDFRARNEGEGSYWWRPELRRRAALTPEQVEQAKAALTPQGGGKSCAHPRTQWYSGQYEKTLECLDCRVELDERKL